MGSDREAGVKWYASFYGHFYWIVVPLSGLEAGGNVVYQNSSKANNKKSVHIYKTVWPIK